MGIDDTARMKTCQHCLSEFAPPRRGWAIYCSAKCRGTAWARKDRVANPERQLEAGRRYYAANREASIACSRKWKADNKEANQATHREWCRKNADKCRQWNRERYYADPQKSIKAAQAWVAKNPERREAYRKAHYQKNYAAYLATSKFRKRTVRRATPPWLTAEQRAAIVAVYAAAVQAKHDVDHIVPLQGKTVSGLHVPWNLQTLPPKLNRAKSNHHVG